MADMIDIFNDSNFTLRALSGRINSMPAVPTRIAQMQLFTPVPQTQALISLDCTKEVIGVVPVSERGGPGTVAAEGDAFSIPLKVPHFKLEAKVQAEDVSGLRAMGTTDGVETVLSKVTTKLAGHRKNYDTTFELMRMGALMGDVKVQAAPGNLALTTYANLFTAFGIGQTVVDFGFSSASCDVVDAITDAKRQIGRALGVILTSRIMCLASPEWFKAFRSHAKVEAAYALWRDGEFLRTDNRTGFSFAGVTFEEYDTQIGGAPFIPAGEARFFPADVPGLFEAHIAPADYMETVNTPGQLFYARQKPNGWNTGMDIQSQMNVLPICTRPKTLIKATKS